MSTMEDNNSENIEVKPIQIEINTDEEPQKEPSSIGEKISKGIGIILASFGITLFLILWVFLGFIFAIEFSIVFTIVFSLLYHMVRKHPVLLAVLSLFSFTILSFFTIFVVLLSIIHQANESLINK